MTQRITILGDIHGNLAPPEAVFADIKARERGGLYCLEDLAGFGTPPNEITGRLRNY